MRWLLCTMVLGVAVEGLSVGLMSENNVSLEEQEKHLFFAKLLDPTGYIDHPGWKEMCRRIGFSAGVIVASGIIGGGIGMGIYKISSLHSRRRTEEGKAGVCHEYGDKISESSQIVDAMNNFLGQLSNDTPTSDRPKAAMPLPNPAKTSKSAYDFDRRAKIFKRIGVSISLFTFWLCYLLLSKLKNWYLLAHDTRYQKTLQRILDHWPEYRARVPAMFLEQFDTLHEVYQAGGGRHLLDEEAAALIIQTAAMQSLTACRRL